MTKYNVFNAVGKGLFNPGLSMMPGFIGIQGLRAGKPRRMVSIAWCLSGKLRLVR